MTPNELIDQYIKLLVKWNKKINLVQARSLLQVFGRHIKDSLQICEMLSKNDLLLDIGAGAGFPGVILAIQGFNNVILCEKNHKKCTFLREVKGKLGLNFEIYEGDIYNFNAPRGALQKIIAVSRGFGSLTKLLDIMDNISIEEGVFHKGEKYLQ
jgi:16S rRNA (guanine(527)-N(7))-methyltransferase RsmG